MNTTTPILATRNDAWGFYGTMEEQAEAAWPIDRKTSKQYGIPAGLPYLTGWVVHCEIVEEAMFQ